MSEEENEFINIIKETINAVRKIDKNDTVSNQMEKLLNLIEKRQKEIEKLTLSNKELDKECTRLEKKEVKMQKEIDELKEYMKNAEHNYQVAIKETIHKSKIEDKILTTKNIIELLEIEEPGVYKIKELENEVRTLQELLEE